MEFSLWDVEVGKQLGHFNDEKAAMMMVRKLVDRFGDNYADELGLGRVDNAGVVLPHLSGAALLERSREVLDDRSGNGSSGGVVIGSRISAAVQELMKRVDDCFSDSRVGRHAHASSRNHRT